MVFDFSDQDGLFEVITFFPDFPEKVEHGEDIFIYFDNIRVGDAPDDTSTDKPVFNTTEIKVFPNPAYQFANLAAEAGTAVGLYSITGSLMEQKIAGQENVTFNISGLSQGIYLIWVVQNRVPVSKKLMIY